MLFSCSSFSPTMEILQIAQVSLTLSLGTTLSLVTSSNDLGSSSPLEVNGAAAQAVVCHMLVAAAPLPSHYYVPRRLWGTHIYDNMGLGCIDTLAHC